MTVNCFCICKVGHVIIFLSSQTLTNLANKWSNHVRLGSQGGGTEEAVQLSGVAELSRTLTLKQCVTAHGNQRALFGVSRSPIYLVERKG